MRSEITRRGVLSWGAAVSTRAFISPLGQTSDVTHRAAPSVSLKKAAERANLLYGSPLFPQDLSKPEVLNLYAAHCSLVVVTVYMKRVQPRSDQFDFSDSDTIKDFAIRNGMKIRGHPLIYGKATPEWVRELSRNEADRVLEKHVNTVVGRYKGHVHSWDVVNEAIDISAPNGFRPTPWFQLVGPEYIANAFHVAHEADPKALLCYNDFGIEGDGAEQEEKRERVLRLLDRLVARNVPIGALGVQSHIGAMFAGTKIHSFLERVRDMKLKVIISELDVRDNALPAKIEVRDAGVAKAYRRYLDSVISSSSVEAVVTWGLYDPDSWLTDTQPRKDGLPQRPLPFDEQLRPKQAFNAILRSFSQRRAAGRFEG